MSDLCEKSMSDVSILLVEDEESSIDFTTQLVCSTFFFFFSFSLSFSLFYLNQSFFKLEKLGYRCQVARNGEQAVGKVLKHSYDLVLMDITLPVMDGIQATNRIRELEQKVRKTK